MIVPAPPIARTLDALAPRAGTVSPEAFDAYPILAGPGDRPGKHSRWFATPIGDMKLTALLVPRVVDVVCRITRAAGRWQTLGNGEMAMSLRMPDLVGIAYGYYQATDPADILSLAFADVNRAQVLLRRPNGGIGYWRHHGHIINAIGCEQQHGFRATVVFGAAFSSLFYAPSRAAFLRQVVRSIGGLIDAVPVVTPASPFLSQSRVP